MRITNKKDIKQLIKELESSSKIVSINHEDDLNSHHLISICEFKDLESIKNVIFSPVENKATHLLIHLTIQDESTIFEVDKYKNELLEKLNLNIPYYQEISIEKTTKPWTLYLIFCK